MFVNYSIIVTFPYYIGYYELTHLFFQYNKMTLSELQTAKILGINEGCMMRLMKGLNVVVSNIYSIYMHK